MFHLFSDIGLAIFLAAAAVQFAVLILLFGKVAACKEIEEDISAGLPAVSLIICARNEKHNLQILLPQLLKQEYPRPWEIILVDDASSDGTASWIKDQIEMHKGIRAVLLPQKNNPGKKYALEQGILAAKYPVLVFTDADCRCSSPQWLRIMASRMAANPECALVLGYAPLLPANGLLNAWSRYEVAHTATLYLGFALHRWPYMGVGRNLLWRKELFLRNGGFSQHLHLASGDDDLLVNQTATGRNVAICLNPQTYMYSAAPHDWQHWISQKTRHLSASLAYKWPQQLALAAVGASWPFFYFFALLLLVLQKYAWIAVIVYTLRLILLLYWQKRIFQTLREAPLLRRVPLFDGCIALYYGAFVPLRLLFPGKLKWK